MKTLLLLLFIFCCTAGLNAQIVNIPDAEFKYILVNYESYFSIPIDTNEDGEIQYSEAAAFSGTLQVGDPGWVFDGNIQDLTGIEAFVNITELICINNQLTDLDLSQNTSLVKVNCAHNELISLNVSQCTALEELTCSYNQLTALNVSQNIALQYLDCGHNQLTTLNVSQNQNIKILYCYENQLTILDLTNNINLDEFSGFDNSFNLFDIRNGNNTAITLFTTFNNPDLTCIFVDNANYCQNSSAWAKDPASAFVETQQQCDDLAAVEDFWHNQIKVYPNPIHDFLYFQNNSLYKIQQIRLIDISGKTIFEKILKNEQKINLSWLKSGVYFIQLSNKENQSITKKIIKL